MKTNYSYILILILFCYVNTVNSQNFEWTKSMGDTLNDIGTSIHVDISGNVYTSGNYSGTVDFDPGTGIKNLTYVGVADIFIQKLDALGNFIWAKSIGGSLNDIVRSMSVDLSGNIYLTGSFAGTADFDPGIDTANLVSSGNSDIFILKLDSSGNFLWARSFGGSTFVDFGSSISVDASGIYTTGIFKGTVDFDPGTGTANITSSGYLSPSVGAVDIFIQKLDASGNFLWANSIGGSGNDYSHSSTIDGDGNIYTTGTFRGTVDFDPSSGIYNLNGGTDDLFIQKLDSLGNLLWAKSIPAATLGYVPYSISTDNSGNVYTAGIYGGTTDFDPDTGIVNLTTAGLGDIFIQKLDTSGKLLWAKSIGGPTNDIAKSIKIDASNNIYLAGTYTGTVDFDPGLGIANLSSVGKEDIFIAKLDSLGNFIWAQSIGGNESENVESMSIGANNNTYTTGSYQGTVDFDFGTGTAYQTSIGRTDIFTLKMNQLITSTRFNETKTDIKLVSYPNPTKDAVQITFENQLNNVELTLTTISGKLISNKIYASLVNTRLKLPESSGIYFLTIISEKSQSVIKLIKE